MGDSDAGDASARELRAVGRFEWEQIICRARFSGLIGGSQNVGKTGKRTRGGVSAAAFKAVALVWASHADPDGTEIYPGDATLAVEAEVGLQVAQAVKAKLIDLGLTERTRAGARRLRRPDVYRLTLPSDLLDRVEVLTPAALKVAALAEYEKRRGKRGGSSGSPTEPAASVHEGGPSDPQQRDGVGGPLDPPHDEGPPICGGSDGPANDGCGGSDGPVVGGPMERDTNPDRALYRPTPSDGDLRTDLAVARATASDEDPIELVVPALADARADQAPERCGHGLPVVRRGDGALACPMCRRGLPAAGSDGALIAWTARQDRAAATSSQPGGEHLAPVIPLRGKVTA